MILVWRAAANCCAQADLPLAVTPERTINFFIFIYGYYSRSQITSSWANSIG